MYMKFLVCGWIIDFLMNLVQGINLKMACSQVKNYWNDLRNNQMKYLMNENSIGYIFSGIMKGLKMGVLEVVKNIIQEKREELKKKEIGN